MDSTMISKLIRMSGTKEVSITSETTNLGEPTVIVRWTYGARELAAAAPTVRHALVNALSQQEILLG